MSMKLWILEPVKNLPEDNNPWIPWYDKMFAVVVRADSEESARSMAHSCGGDENDESSDISPWMELEYSTCKPLEAEGEARIIILDVHSA